MIMESLKKVWVRLCLKTPAFFGRVKIIGAGLGGAAITIRTTYPDLPAYMERPLEYCIVAGGISILIAQMTVQHPDQVHGDPTITTKQDIKP